VNREATAELLAALAYGERLAAGRARSSIRFAPDARRGEAQRGIADREERNCRLIEARLGEVGSIDLTRRFEPFFDAFFAHTEPGDWVEAQAFHYVGDALVSDFADHLVELVDPVSAEIVRHTLGEREDQEEFALEELTRALDHDPRTAERVAAYARRIVGEGLTQTRRALDQSVLLQELLGKGEGEKRLVLDLLDQHRGRLDRLGVERVEADSPD
jgi:tRNA-(MS[2]IO[6]A)-hydroxylase MiaE-like protein